MKCFGKNAQRRRDRAYWDAVAKNYEERMSKMTPEEQEEYKRNRDKRLAQTLGGMAAISSMCGNYYK